MWCVVSLGSTVRLFLIMVFYFCAYGSKGSRFDESVSMHVFPTDEKRNC